MNFSGAVLAGGKSSRMGRNKALLRIDGEPLWRRQLRILKESGADPVWLVQAPGQPALTRGVLRDTVREAGPIAGLHAAFLAIEPPGVRPDILRSPARERRDKTSKRRTHLAVVAVDLPHLEPAWFTRLAKLCAPGIGAVARTPDSYEPLAAIYPHEALAEVESRLNEGALALQELIAALVRSRRMRVLPLKAAECRQLANWNMPTDIGQVATGSPSRSFRMPKAKAGRANRSHCSNAAYLTSSYAKPTEDNLRPSFARRRLVPPFGIEPKSHV